MSNIKKLMMSSAAGGETLNVESVFSTYLYEGNGSTQSITNGIALADGLGGGTATSFDGVDDFLSRSSDLTGNADGKTFTFSSWVIRTGANTRAIYPLRMQGFFYIEVASNGRITIGGANTSGSTVLSAITATNAVPLNTWTHILVSVDLTNTSNRYVYLNDVATSMTWSTYSNQNIDFTKTTSHVNSNTVGSFGAAIHSNIYLDYTYRDLSQTSNRRIFIDADGGSTPTSTLSALNPIVYLPMTDTYSVGKNLGTGGDYTVNGSPTIVNNGTEWQSGYGEGGLVWIKNRDAGDSHMLFDTERGASKTLSSNEGGVEVTNSDTLTQFLADGFLLDDDVAVNTNGEDYVSWTFRKAPKFFDVVTFAGTGVAGLTIDHNLGSVPGMIIVKSYDDSRDWVVYHRGVDATNPEDYAMVLQKTVAREDNATWFNDTAPTDTQFTVGNKLDINRSGYNYVAYLFAHNDGDGEFGPNGDADIIKCGSYTGNGSSNGPEIDLGFEPQWVMIKNASSTGPWVMLDNMRGWPVTDENTFTDRMLWANTSNAEYTTVKRANLTSTGFHIRSTNSQVNTNNNNYIYMAIRRGTKVPESATEVFDIYQNESIATVPAFKHPFPVDFGVYKATSYTEDWWYSARPIQGQNYRLNVQTYSGGASSYAFDYMDGWLTSNSNQTDYYSWAWKRAPGFFDISTYSGTNSVQNVPHNLGVAPKLMIIRMLEQNAPPAVYWEPAGNTENYFLTSTGNTDNSQYWNSTTPTDTVFTVKGPLGDVNYSGYNYCAMLFGELDGISKIGSYVGNGSTQNIDCGFTSGARFVLIKGSTSGDWFIFDTKRGIVAGDDPYLRWNNGGAQVTNRDFIDPYSSGFTVNTDVSTLVNASGTTYYFYAIA